MIGKQPTTPGERVEYLFNAIDKKRDEQHENGLLLQKFDYAYSRSKTSENENKLNEQKEKMTKTAQDISKLEKDLRHLCDTNPEARLTELNINLLIHINRRKEPYEQLLNHLQYYPTDYGHKYPTETNDLLIKDIKQSEEWFATYQQIIKDYEKQNNLESKNVVPKSLQNKLNVATIEAEKKIDKLENAIELYESFLIASCFNLKEDQVAQIRKGTLHADYIKKNLLISKGFKELREKVLEPEVKIPAKAQPVVPPKTPPKETTKETKPAWIDKVYKTPKLLVSTEGYFKEAVFKTELQKLNNQGLIKNYELTDTGFKLTTSKNKDIVFNTQENKIYSQDFSQQTYDVAAKTTLAMGAKGFDMSELVTHFQKDPKKNQEILYRAYVAGRKLEGFIFTNLPHDVRDTLETKFLNEAGKSYKPSL